MELIHGSAYILITRIIIHHRESEPFYSGTAALGNFIWKYFHANWPPDCRNLFLERVRIFGEDYRDIIGTFSIWVFIPAFVKTKEIEDTHKFLRLRCAHFFWMLFLGETMDYYFYNTNAQCFDKNRQNRRINFLIKQGIAVTGGDRKYGEKLGKLSEGDILLMYENKVGVVAFGKVIEPWDRYYKDPIYYIPEKRQRRVFIPA